MASKYIFTARLVGCGTLKNKHDYSRIDDPNPLNLIIRLVDRLIDIFIITKRRPNLYYDLACYCLSKVKDWHPHLVESDVKNINNLRKRWDNESKLSGIAYNKEIVLAKESRKVYTVIPKKKYISIKLLRRIHAAELEGTNLPYLARTYGLKVSELKSRLADWRKLYKLRGPASRVQFDKAAEKAAPFKGSRNWGQIRHNETVNIFK